MAYVDNGAGAYVDDTIYSEEFLQALLIQERMALDGVIQQIVDANATQVEIQARIDYLTALLA